MTKPMPGKFYIVDTFSEPGDTFDKPFDSFHLADRERRSLNIAADCVVAQFRVTDEQRKVGRLFPVSR